MPLDIGSHDPIRIPITDGASFAAGLRDAGEHAARMGPVMLVANTPDFDAGHSALDRVRMTVSGLDVQVRMVTDGHVWMDVDHNSAGPVTPEHLREVAALFPPPVRSVTPAELADRFAPRGTDLTPALTAGEATWETDVLGTREALVAERDWITATVHQATTTGTPLSDHDAARLLLNIHNSELRDHAVTGMHTHNAAAHTHLWADLTARAPEAYRDPHGPDRAQPVARPPSRRGSHRGRPGARPLPRPRRPRDDVRQIAAGPAAGPALPRITHELAPDASGPSVRTSLLSSAASPAGHLQLEPEPRPALTRALTQGGTIQARLPTRGFSSATMRSRGPAPAT